MIELQLSVNFLISKNWFDTGKIYLFVEFCAYGTLESFLKKINSSLHTGIFTDDLLEEVMKDWIMQTVDGMQFLSSQNIIHGDLSVRSLLLKDIDNIKISGFGTRKQINKHCRNHSSETVSFSTLS